METKLSQKKINASRRAGFFWIELSQLVAYSPYAYNLEKQNNTYYNNVEDEHQLDHY